MMDLPDGQEPARVHDGGTDALGAEPVRDIQREFGHCTDADDQHIIFGRALGAPGEHIDAVAEPLNGFHLGPDAALGVADHAGGVLIATASRSSSRSRLASRGAARCRPGTIWTMAMSHMP